jgi:hypothetical protein
VEGEARVTGDAAMPRHALGKLISNAFSATPCPLHNLATAQQ